MENSEILCLQFELIVLQLDSRSDKSWEICSSADSEPTTTRQNEASVDTWCMCFNWTRMSATKECLCYHELNECEYFKIKTLYIYLLTVLQIFFIKLINEHAALHRFVIIAPICSACPNLS